MSFPRAAGIVEGGLHPAFRPGVRLTCRSRKRQGHAGAKRACAESISIVVHPARRAAKGIAGGWKIWWTIRRLAFPDCDAMRALQRTRRTYFKILPQSSYLTGI
jgi:hypothetical protein